MTTTTYRISTTDGSQDLRLRDEYHSADEAAAALAAVMGWDGVVLSDSFSTYDGQARCAYESQEECDADGEGAYAPRIIEVVA